MKYSLRGSTCSDKAWLESLRRAVYESLFYATWGSWDEDRHVRHFSESWKRGGIQMVEIDKALVGMIQTHELDDSVEIDEIQILPTYQGEGVGSALLLDVIRSATDQKKDVVLSTGIMNVGAHRLYKRLGFNDVERTPTHIHMRRFTGGG